MNILIRLSFISFSLLILSLSVNAQVSFSATTERTRIATGEQITIVATLVTTKKHPNIPIPSVSVNDAFSLLKSNSRQSSSTSIQITNGKAIKKNEITTQFYYVITPLKPGAFTFPALSISIGGKQYQTRPIQFSVSAEPVKNADIKTFLYLSKKKLYPGEQTLLTFKVAQRAQTQGQLEATKGFNAVLDKIDNLFSGNFALTKLFTNKVTTGTERIDGELYNVYSLRYLLFPLNAGTFQIGSIPYEYQMYRRTRRRRSMDPFFDDFFGGDIFGGGVQAVSKMAMTNPFSVTVSPLPPAPKTFSGAVGTFSITASAAPLNVPTGEPVTLKVLFRGNTRPGNMADITVAKSDSYELFTPEKQVHVDTLDTGIRTRKTYKYLLIPRKEGSVTIPPVSFCFFDPTAETYKTITSDAISLSVSKGKDDTPEQTRYLTQEEIREVGKDIRYIKTDVVLKPQSRYAYRNPLFYLLFPLPIIFIIFSLLYRFQSVHRNRNITKQIKNRALVTALRKISVVKKRFSSLEPSAFLGKITGILETYISQRFDIVATGRTLDELKDELSRQIKTEDNTVADLTSYIEKIDHYRFGGATLDDTSRHSLLTQAESFLTDLDKSAKKGKKS